jgi:Mg-chelatase subunit ChlD
MRLLSPGFLALLLVIPPLALLTLRSARSLPPARVRAFLGLRIAAMLLLALALAGPALVRTTDRLAVAFLLDESHSVGEEQRARGLEMVGNVRAGMADGDAALLVRFGANAEIERLSPGRPPQADAGGDIDGSATDIGAALRLALARAASSPLRVVLLSDGNQNRGSAEEAAAEARSLGARIFPFALSPAAAAGEVSIADIAAPAVARAGEPHQVTVLLRSLAPVRARVSLFRDGEPAGSRDSALVPGENPIAFTGFFPERGLHFWEALVQAPSDRILENNRCRKFVEVTGNPQVLYAARSGKGSPALLSALAAQGIAVVETDGAALPGSLAGFLPYDGVILDNVPGFGLSYEKMETLERYVRDAGGGLLMIGGENSFGAGGYYKTPVERALPVDMDVKSQLQMPRLSLVIVADKSGSMGGMVTTGEAKIDVVKSAAFSAVELLNPFDRAGLLAFDADFEWTVPLTEAGNREQIARELSTLSPGGGTILYPALEEAYRALSASPSPLRHIIVLSDGLTNPGDFETLVRRIARDKITVSAVAVGDDADKDLLSKIAGWGGGRYYAASDPRGVPRIFMTETILVSRGLLIEKRFLPSVWSANEIISGIPPEQFPPLDGFVLTYMKNGAEKVLAALYDAPLLASWRYGLGKSAAFTADLRGRWGKAWTAWDDFPRFAAQLVRWIEKPGSSELLHPRIGLSGGRGWVSVDAHDELGRFANGLDIRGVVLGPNGEREEITIAQTGPGLYEGSFRAERVGDYTVTVSARAEPGAPSGSAQDLAPRTLGVSRPYSDEYRILGADTRLLDRLAQSTGGRRAASADDEAALAAILHREPGGAGAASTGWWALLAAALALFVMDIAVRKFSLSDTVRERLARIFGGQLSLDRLFRRRPGYSYEELQSLVARAREEEKRKLRHRISEMASEGKVDPDLAAYLYIAKLRGRRAQSREKEK